MSDDYVHPESGRVYREEDPAHRFAQLTAALARECELFLHYHRDRLEGRDYLTQHAEWMPDPDSVARSIGSTIEALGKAYTAVTVDRDLYRYGLGKQDDEWRRKYGSAGR